MIKIKILQTIDVGDFHKLVIDTYGRLYNFQQQDCCKSKGLVYITVPAEDSDYYENNTIPDEVNGMGVSFNALLACDSNECNGCTDKNQWSIDLFWYRNFYPSINMIINDLYSKDLLPAGEYAIDINW
jgi:hypothetical protein